MPHQIGLQQSLFSINENQNVKCWKSEIKTKTCSKVSSGQAASVEREIAIFKVCDHSAEQLILYILHYVKITSSIDMAMFSQQESISSYPKLKHVK